jgi:hypothetical protein
MLRYLFFIVSLFAIQPANAQPKTDKFLESLLAGSDGKILQQVIHDTPTYRCQIIYTEINRDANNIPHFKNYYFNYDPLTYFNPASIVKLPLAFLSLEKLNEINKKKVNKNTIIQYDSSYPGQRTLYRDTSAANGFPTIDHFIRRAFLISENDPYNRMYQFVGQGEINRKLHEKGYTDVRITRQFMGFTPEQNRHTNPIRFINKHGKLLYAQPAAYNTDSFDFSHGIFFGKAYFNRNDSLIPAPFDFTMHNNLSLEDVQQMLQSVLFPVSVPEKQRFHLTKSDYKFLYRFLSQYPSETSDPKYDSAVFYDSYVKFFFRDSTHRMPPYVRVFNKVGWSYGFLTDVSYVVDFKNNVEFMLSANIYVNSDQVLNDNKYEYDSIGHPFLYQLGQAIYKYELQRERPFKPNLDRFKLKYDKRDPRDKRPSLKDVDN